MFTIFRCGRCGAKATHDTIEGFNFDREELMKAQHQDNWWAIQNELDSMILLSQACQEGRCAERPQSDWLDW